MVKYYWIVDVLTNPVVQRVLLGITGFIEKFFPIVAGVVGSAVGIMRLLDQMGGFRKDNLLMLVLYCHLGYYQHFHFT